MLIYVSHTLRDTPRFLYAAIFAFSMMPLLLNALIHYILRCFTPPRHYADAADDDARCFRLVGHFYAAAATIIIVDDYWLPLILPPRYMPRFAMIMLIFSAPPPPLF